MSIDAWGEPTPDHMKPLNLTEDRTPEQLAADGDEPVPCGAIASVTHCCEYHAIHSDDELDAAVALLPTAEQLRADKRISIEAKRRLADLVDHMKPFECGVHSTLYDPGVCADCDFVRVQRAEQALLTIAREYDEEWLRASVGGARCFPNHPEAQRDVRLYQAIMALKGLKP